ncbi:MAG TPA: hypothetical protein VJ717_04880, partial [Gemmatimonadaceae bacterium]|nr:hypothetical protein [Gemmatimonadaceae bacterium]
KRESWEQMWSPANLAQGGHAMVLGDLYGFGFLLSDVRGHRFAGHGGASGTFILHFLDAPISVIVLTNLSSTAGRHAPLLARAIAGHINVRYRAPDQLTPQTDPEPSLTASVRALLPEFAKGNATELMTAAHRFYFNEMPASFRNRMNAPLGTITALTAIACDTVEGRGIRYTDPVSRICYYRAERSGAPNLYVTVYLTKEGKVAHLTF